MAKIPSAKVYFSPSDISAIKNDIESVLKSGQLTLGKFGRIFENEFAKYAGSKFAASVNGGTSALEICLRIFGVKDKEVIVPTNTFFATPAAVLHAGGKVCFTDINKKTLCLDLKNIKKNLHQNTKGIIIVHIGGIISPEIRKIRDFCDERNLFLLEDAAHAHGSSFNKKNAGGFGHASAFSFYPTKVITSAEGGMIVTDNSLIYEEALIYKDQGKAGFFSNIHNRLGYNWRMSEPHAIIGLHHLKHLDEFIKQRQRIADIYDAGIKKIPHISTIELPAKLSCNYYKYICLLDKKVKRQELKKILKEKYEIGLSGEVYELPCHLQPIFKKASGKQKFPVAEDLCQRHICLPVFPQMTNEEARYVLSSLHEALS